LIKVNPGMAKHRYAARNDSIRCHPMPHDQYQTVRELADRLKVAEATVRHWIRIGELRAIDIGKGWRIADSDLAGFLERHQTAPRDPAGAAHSQDRRCPN
jgi:excisionase family DNA binding protein